MNLSAPFIKRPVMTCLVMMALLFFGFMSYEALPVSDLPSIEYPTLVVTGNMPGGSPQTMANSVATPLEKAFLSVEGLRMMTSSSTQGSTQIVLQFTLDTDINGAAADVNASISGALALLPPEMPSNPTYQKVNPADAPVLYLRLSSYTDTLGDLYEWANTYVGERVSLVPGVAQVTVYGSSYSPRIRIDPQTLAAKGLDLNDIKETVNQANVYLPLGDIDGAERYFLFDANGQVMDGAGYNSLIYKTHNGAYSKIHDIGHTVDSLQNDKTLSYYMKNGIKDQASVVLAIQKVGNANTVILNQMVLDMIPVLKQQMPGSVDIGVIFDRSLSIKESVNEVELTLLLSIVLVVAVIFIYLGRITDTLIPTFVLPITLIAVFAFMYLSNYSIDTLSLLALTLAIGFVVDDAIVVLENIVRHTELGREPYDAAMEGSKQISITVFTMTIALRAVFIPIIFLPGMLGRIFHEFALTIAVTILISGAISLSLTPMLAARLVSKGNQKTKLAEFSEKLNHKMIAVYEPCLKKVLDWPKATLLGGLLALLLTVFLFKHTPTTLNMNDDMGFIVGTTQTAQNMSSINSQAHQQDLARLFLKDPAVQEVVSVCAKTSNSGIVFVKLIPYNERANVFDVIKNLYPKVLNEVGINCFMRAPPLINLDSGAGSNSDYQYTLTSLDPSILYPAANTLIQTLQKEKGFINVNSDMLVNTPQLEMSLWRERASLLGVTAQQIENNLQLGFSGNKISLIDAPTDQFYVIMEVLEHYQQDPDNLKILHIKSADGKVVYMRDLMSIDRTVGPSAVNHFNQLASVTLQYSLDSSLPLSNALNRIEELKKDLLPKEISGQLIGAAQEFEATMSSFMVLIIITVFFIYVLLGILYESFIFPITVLSALPVAVLGGLLTLMIFNQILSVYGMVGMVMLMGIVQKNGIILIDYAVEIMRDKKVPAKEAIYEACTIRFRPIIMTTLAAIMGAVPIAIGFGASGASRRPLGLIVVGGLMFSQLLTLFLTPVVFVKMEQLRHIFRRKEL